MSNVQPIRDASRVAKPLRLEPSDFRFLSACIQGIDIREAWLRYQAHRGASDLRRMRTTARALIDALHAIGRRHGVQGVAVLRRDPGRIVESRRAHRADELTLDMFREGLDDPDFYSEEEVLELWRQRFEGATQRRRGGASSDVRRARLVRRQLEVLWALEHLASAAPRPSDPLDAWLFSAAMSRRLHRVGISTLSQLVFFIRQHGYRWYRKVPQVGEEGAKRLVDWLRQHEGTLGSVSIAALAPRAVIDVSLVTPRPVTAVAPLERFVLPAAYSGIGAANRAPQREGGLQARDDGAAVQAWLVTFQPSRDSDADAGTGNTHTWRTYRKEAERLLLWSVLERSKALSGLESADLLDYQRFLAAPGPEWVGDRKVPRWSEHWRPFGGPLSASSVRLAVSVIRSMFAWLVQVGYLRWNPSVPVPTAPPQPARSAPVFSDAEWSALQEWTARASKSPAVQRQQRLLRLTMATGLADQGLLAARTDWLHRSGQQWMLCEPLNPSKPVVINDVELARQLTKTAPGTPVPLIQSLERPGEPIGRARLYELFKAAFANCASTIHARDPRMASRIAAATPNWIRTTRRRALRIAAGQPGCARD